MQDNLTIILGGAASGKSSYAEQIVNAAGLPKTYVATAQAYDAEMEAKIADHRLARGKGWTTIEAPLDVIGPVNAHAPGQIMLLDCATMWLSNLIMDNRDIDDACAALIASLSTARGPIVVVTNEVGAGIVPDNALARRFRNAQGRLNQMLAAEAATVITVMAGLPMALKGKLP